MAETTLRPVYEMEDAVGAVSIEPQHRVSYPEFSWQDIREPGAYVEKESGYLYRIPQEALLRGGSLLIRKQSYVTSRFVQISKNPYITTLEARMLACEYNIQPNF